MYVLWLGSVRCYVQGKFGIGFEFWVPVSVKLELGSRDVRLGLWLGSGLTLPKTSTLTINRNPQNSLFE